MIKALYEKFKASTVVSTDTRKLSDGAIFFALKGENFNGNTYVEAAFNAGAKFCVVDEEKAVINSNCILVTDVLKTLQELATYHRKQLNYPIIALTGSNGKTTTKELIYAVLHSTYKVKATKGNLNNHIGVPLTLLSFTEDLDFGIVEMGANHQKEIEFLSNIAQPDFGLITNFGKAHLEGFGGVEGVIKGKSELYDFLKNNHKTAFINTDDLKQITQIGNYKNTITFGTKPNNYCTVKFLNADPFVTLNYKNSNIKSQLIGHYNFNNIAIAIAIGQHFNVSEATIKQAIETYIPSNNRSQIINQNGNTIILDAYNANPTSMLAALENFKQINSLNKYLFIGDMFELGDKAEKEHQVIVDYIESYFENDIYIVGAHFYNTKTSIKIQAFNSFEDLAKVLSNLNIEDAHILIKGSRGMALERVLQFI